MIRRWSTAWNNYWFTTHLLLEEIPLFYAFLEWLTLWTGHYLFYIPKIGELFYIHIEAPIIQFIFKKTKMIWIPLPYEYVRKTFPEDCKHYEERSGFCGNGDDDENEEVIHNKSVMMGIYEEFMNTMNKLEERDNSISRR